MTLNRSADVRKRYGDESGQTTLFVLCSFFTFFIFLALVANVGQAVNRRVMLQMVADAGAFSGASAQATAMNTISYCNGYIFAQWVNTEISMLGFTIQFCGVDMAITGSYIGLQAAMATIIEVTNHAGVAWVLLEAEAATQRNIDELFPDGTVHTPLQAISPMLGFGGGGSLVDTFREANHLANLSQAWPAFPHSIVNLQPEDPVEKHWVCYYPPYELEERSATFNLWYSKSNPDEVTRFYWWVYAEPVDALVLPQSRFPFGFPQIPAMFAVALAKPVGGEVGTGEFEDWFNFAGHKAKYVARMMPLDTINAAFVDLGSGIPLPAEVLH